MTSKVTYLGELRTQCRHLRSGNEFITDAPLDNNGRGEAFSPTDTVATALASCMLTVMGIKAQSMDLELKGAYAEVTKKMAANPRRISGIEVSLYFSSAIEEKERGVLERVGNTCPVIQSIHPDIETVIQYHWTL